MKSLDYGQIMVETVAEILDASFMFVCSVYMI